MMNVVIEKEWCSESLGVSLDMQHHHRETAFLFEKHLAWTVWYSGRPWNLRFKKGFYERFALRFIENDDATFGAPDRFGPNFCRRRWVAKNSGRGDDRQRRGRGG
jgi:hypothetical protein